MLWGTPGRPNSCSWALEGVPNAAPSRPPSLRSAETTHMGCPPDSQATLSHHPISCSPTNSPQAVLIPAWLFPGPARASMTQLSLRVLRDHQAHSHFSQKHNMVRQADQLSGKSRLAFTRQCRKPRDCLHLGMIPALSSLPEGGAKGMGTAS